MRLPRPRAARAVAQALGALSATPALPLARPARCGSPHASGSKLNVSLCHSKYSSGPCVCYL